MSDVKTAKIGIRKFTYQKVRPFTVFCNGQKILLRGADWGMDEGMLRCDRQGFETRLRMEKEMNFNILRNCLGNVSKEDFFDLCDRYGLMVWEEFGINHETTPVNIDTFMANARDRLLARRNHACVLLWCTANEGGPTEPIASAMPKLVAELDGTRFYQRHSTMAPTDGDGTYDTRRPTFYFQTTRGFHPECGSHTVPAVESMRRMMPREKLWPINETWATHDWINAGGSLASKPTEEAIASVRRPDGHRGFLPEGPDGQHGDLQGDLRVVQRQDVEQLHRHDDLDEQSLLAVAGLEHLRLLLRADRGLFRLQKGLRADSRPVELRLGRGEGGQRHAGRSRRTDGGCPRVEPGRERTFHTVCPAWAAQPTA